MKNGEKHLRDQPSDPLSILRWVQDEGGTAVDYKKQIKNKRCNYRVFKRFFDISTFCHCGLKLINFSPFYNPHYSPVWIVCLRKKKWKSWWTNESNTVDFRELAGLSCWIGSNGEKYICPGKLMFPSRVFVFFLSFFPFPLHIAGNVSQF